MRSRSFVRPFAYYALFVFSTISGGSQTVITFDDIPTPHIYASIPNGYQGLSWSTDFSCLNAVSFTSGFGPNGYIYGLVGGSNVAYNGSGSPVEIDALTNFDFLSAYFTGAWNSNLNIEVQGYSGTNLLDDQTVIASATNPTLFTFNYLDIDRLTFNSFGGQNAGFINSGGENFVMDDFTFEFIPEPSSLLLTILGAVTLWAFVKRKH
jgi:hypothetical protein